MKKTSVYFLITLVLAAVPVSGCGKKAGFEKREEIIPVKVMKVELRSLYEMLEYVGTIDQDDITVYPKVSGKVVEKVKEEGSPVAKGDAIVYIDRDEIGLKFEKAPVESPLAGTVGRVYVDIGTSVTPQTPIALVASTADIDIDLNVPGKYLPRLALGQGSRISVDAYPDKEFNGHVTKISPVVDIDTRTAPVEITIDDTGHLLKSGMFAKAKLILEEHKDVPVILKEAIMGKAADRYVFVVDGNKAHLRKVSLGIHEGPYFEVMEGVGEGELVVIMGQQRLRDGVTVAPEE